MKACDNPKCEWNLDTYVGAVTGKTFAKIKDPNKANKVAPEKQTVTYYDGKPELGLCPSCYSAYCMLIEFHPMNNIMV